MEPDDDHAPGDIHGQHGLSPNASSGTSYTPKSSSSAGQAWKYSNLEYEMPPQTIVPAETVADIDSRLESLYE